MAFTGEWQEKRSHVSPTLRCLPIVSSALGLVVKVGPVFRSPAPSQAAPWGSEQWLRAAQSHCPFTHTQTCHCHWPFTQTCHCHCSFTHTQTCHCHCPFTHRHAITTAHSHTDIPLWLPLPIYTDKHATAIYTQTWHCHCPFTHSLQHAEGQRAEWAPAPAPAMPTLCLCLSSKYFWASCSTGDSRVLVEVHP